jgi:hypothetical protein
LGSTGSDGTAGDPRPGRRLAPARSRRFAAVPRPGPEITLRPHSPYALGLELVVAALGLFWFADAVGSDVASAMAGLVVAAAFGVGGPLAYRRHTHAGPDCIEIQQVRRVRRLAWRQVDGFEMLPHRTWRADRIGARTRDGELVALIHQDAKGLAARPEAAHAFYQALIERLETVRRTAGA